jgi:hypothetical protein
MHSPIEAMRGDVDGGTENLDARERDGSPLF